MELSESVQRGIQTLADPDSFDSNAFALLLRAAFQSLLDARADEAALGKRLTRRRGLGGGTPGGAASPAPGHSSGPGKPPGKPSPPSARLWGPERALSAAVPPQGTYARPALRFWPAFPARLFVPL